MVALREILARLRRARLGRHRRSQQSSPPPTACARLGDRSRACFEDPATSRPISFWGVYNDDGGYQALCMFWDVVLPTVLANDAFQVVDLQLVPSVRNKNPDHQLGFVRHA